MSPLLYCFVALLLLSFKLYFSNAGADVVLHDDDADDDEMSLMIIIIRRRMIPLKTFIRVVFLACFHFVYFISSFVSNVVYIRPL